MHSKKTFIDFQENRKVSEPLEQDQYTDKNSGTSHVHVILILITVISEWEIKYSEQPETPYFSRWKTAEQNSNISRLRREPYLLQQGQLKLKSCQQLSGQCMCIFQHAAAEHF